MIWMQESVPVQLLINHLFLLYTLDRFERGIKITKLQKIIFLSQWNGNDKGYQTAGFKFIKYYHGPFSREIDPAIQGLTQNHMVRVSVRPPKGDDPYDSQIKTIAPLEQSSDMLKTCEPLIRKNRAVFGIFDRIIDYVKDKSLDWILEHIYQADFHGVSIKDIPLNTVLITALQPTEIKEPFKIDPDWVSTLEVLFDENTQLEIEEGMNALRKGDILNRTEFSKTL